MRKGPALENLATALVETCRSGLDPETLRASVLPRLRRAVPVDAIWWATVDPATLLFTRGYREEIPEETGPYLVDNEFLGDDSNRWSELAQDPHGVRTLLDATGGDLTRSARYRDIFRPLGLEDELRAVLRSRQVCWGYLCLHREGPSGFSREDTAFVRRIASHLADGIRVGLLIENAGLDETTDAPGLLLLARDGSVLGRNPAAEQWLDELREPASDRMLPIEIYAVAAALRRMGDTDSAQPRLRVRTRAGRWVVLHASWMNAHDRDTVAIVIERAAPFEIAPVVMAAYGLTPRERTVTGLVCRGYSTREIASSLYLTTNSVQDHLKSIFDKTGVRSRRELVATILKQEYLPGVLAEQPIGPSGFFR